MNDEPSEPATRNWIRERWGGFSYLDIVRNESFMLHFDGDDNLWLHHENEEIGRVLLFEKPTKQNVFDAERIFGIEINP
jgi:hypothetical protein